MKYEIAVPAPSSIKIMDVISAQRWAIAMNLRNVSARNITASTNTA